jgi:phosphoribosylanthranilate isomerase
LVKNIPRDEKLLLLAGGLHPDNVGEAIRYLHPDGVDVSSGVEYTDRLGKDKKKVDLFVANARKIL